MGLREELVAEAALAGNIGAVCSVEIAKRKHPEMAEDIEWACRQVDISARIISNKLADYGIFVAAGVVRRHRRQECRCEHD